MMLCVYSPTGFHVLRTQYLGPAELARQKAYYEGLGYVVDTLG